MRTCTRGVATLAAAAAAAGCGAAQSEAPSERAADGTAVMGCRDGGRTTTALTDAERRDSVVAGPLTLVNGRQLAEQPATAFDATRASLRRLIDDRSSRQRERELTRRTLMSTRAGSHGVSTIRIRVRAGRQATLTVSPEHRASVSLIYTAHARNRENAGAAGAYRVDDGDSAVTFRACPDADTEFLGVVVVAGARCCPLQISVPGRPTEHRLLSFGAGECVSSTRADGASADRLWAAASPVLRRRPYMGVACPTPNSIACDRIGLAVWLDEPARRVTANIAGHHLPLRAGGFGGQGPRYWEGYVQPAGLLDGPLKITADRGRHPLYAAVALSVEGYEGSVDNVLLAVALAPGWG